MNDKSQIRLRFEYDDEVYEIKCCPTKFKARTVMQKVGKYWAIIAFNDLPIETQIVALDELDKLKQTYKEVNG